MTKRREPKYARAEQIRRGFLTEMTQDDRAPRQPLFVTATLYIEPGETRKPLPYLTGSMVKDPHHLSDLILTLASTYFAATLVLPTC